MTTRSGTPHEVLVARGRLRQMGMSSLGIDQVLQGRAITGESDRKIARGLIMKIAAGPGSAAAPGTAGVDFVNFEY